MRHRMYFVFVLVIAAAIAAAPSVHAFSIEGNPNGWWEIVNGVVTTSKSVAIGTTLRSGTSSYNDAAESVTLDLAACRIHHVYPTGAATTTGVSVYVINKPPLVNQEESHEIVWHQGETPNELVFTMSPLEIESGVTPQPTSTAGSKTYYVLKVDSGVTYTVLPGNPGVKAP